MNEALIKHEVQAFITRVERFAAAMPSGRAELVKKFKTASGGRGAAMKAGGSEYVFKCEGNGDMSICTWVDGKPARIVRKSASNFTTADAICTEYGII